MTIPPDIRITLGQIGAPAAVFPASNIESIEIFTAANAAADTLPVGELSAILLLDEDPVADWAPMDYLLLEDSDLELLTTNADEVLTVYMLEGLPAGTEVYTTFGGRTEKHYLKSIKRTGKYQVTLTAVDAIGVIEEKPLHMGGLYSGENFSTVAASIFGGSAVENDDTTISVEGGFTPATITPEVAAVKVYGHLPAANRRDNLHALLFAYGAIIQADANGDPLITFPAAGTPTEITDGEIYGGDSITQDAPRGVGVSEHSYAENTAAGEVVLFDNSDGSGIAAGQIVTFDQAPVFGLRTTGALEILASGPNFATVSGTGQLLGTPYTHTAREVALYPDGYPTSDVVRVADNGLISPFNSPMVLRRLLSYIGDARTLQADIVLGDHRPGDLVRLTNAFGQTVDAFIQTARIVPSATTKASCELLAGYDASFVGSAYDTHEILTGEGSWTVPAGVTVAFIRISGGGDGGASGTDGTDAQLNRQVGAGGKGGKGGAGGKVLAATIPLIPGEVITYVCGTGGAGGEPIRGGESQPGADGSGTRFGQWSTDSGAASPAAGVVDLLDRSVIRSAPGADGVDGAAGSSSSGSGSVTFGGETWQNGADGATGQYEVETGRIVKAGGGHGGGAAVGSDGGAGRPGTVSRRGYAETGDGGAGVTAIPGEDGVELGCGGSGGHGGGGGGTSGDASGASEEDTWIGRGGKAGLGSAGGYGGDGYIDLYYKQQNTGGGA